LWLLFAAHRQRRLQALYCDSHRETTIASYDRLRCPDAVSLALSYACYLPLPFLPYWRLRPSPVCLPVVNSLHELCNDWDLCYLRLPSCPQASHLLHASAFRLLAKMPMHATYYAAMALRTTTIPPTTRLLSRVKLTTACRYFSTYLPARGSSPVDGYRAWVEASGLSPLRQTLPFGCCREELLASRHSGSPRRHFCEAQHTPNVDLLHYQPQAFWSHSIYALFVYTLHIRRAWFAPPRALRPPLFEMCCCHAFVACLLRVILPPVARFIRPTPQCAFSERTRCVIEWCAYAAVLCTAPKGVTPASPPCHSRGTDLLFTEDDAPRRSLVGRLLNHVILYLPPVVLFLPTAGSATVLYTLSTSHRR